MPKVNRRISDQQVSEIIEMTQHGFTAQETAREVGVSVPTVLDVMREYGIESGSPGPRSLADKFSVEALEDIKHRYSETDESVKSIIEDYDITYNQIYTLLRSMNVPVRAHKKEDLDAKKQRMDLAVQMYRGGHPLWKIKNETGVHQPQLHAELHTRGVELRRSRKKKE